MIHAVFNRLDYALEVIGAGGRLRVPALSSATGLPAGHYRIARYVGYQPWSTNEGPGRIELADLGEVAVEHLVDAGRAVRRPHDNLLAIDGIVGALGGLARHRSAQAGPATQEGTQDDIVSIHGGGVGDDATSPFQRLVPPPAGGLRIHNSDFEQIALRLVGGSAAIRVVVLSIVGDT